MTHHLKTLIKLDWSLQFLSVCKKKIQCTLKMHKFLLYTGSRCRLAHMVVEYSIKKTVSTVNGIEIETYNILT